MDKLKHKLKRTDRLRTFSGMLVVFFLLTFITSRSLNSISVYQGAKEYALLKNSNSPLKPDAQSPYEEFEKENEDASEDDNSDEKNTSSHQDLVFISLIGEPLLLSNAGLQSDPVSGESYSWKTSSDLPIYLFKRTILI
ncbi:MAG: hypothetical protein ACJ76F_03610 [Bacteroidia bacterium]